MNLCLNQKRPGIDEKRIPLHFSLLLLLLLLVPVCGKGQGEEITLRQAIELGLVQNRRAQIAALEVERAEKGATAGAAGILPEVDLYGGVTGSLNNTRQEFATGEIAERNGAVSSGYSFGIDANWTVFDGFASWRRLDLLHEEEELSRAAERDEREQIVTEIATTYLEIVLLQDLVRTAEEAILLSTARRDLARDRVEVGASIRFELTQAQVDLNADSGTLLRLELDVEATKVRLNRLLNRPPSALFTVTDSVESLLPLPPHDELRERVVRSNMEVQQALLRVEQEKMREKLVRSELYPLLSLNLGYDFVGSSADAGLLLSNRTSGLNYSLNARWNIFNGFATKGRLEQAELSIRQSELQYEERVAVAEADFEILYREWERESELVEYERRSIASARENLQLAADRLELGAVTSFEVRQAQTRFIEAGSRRVQAEYRLKLLELRILRLSGDILRLAGE